MRQDRTISKLSELSLLRDLTPDQLQEIGIFLLRLHEDSDSVHSEKELIQNTIDQIQRAFHPAAFFLAYSLQGDSSRFVCQGLSRLDSTGEIDLSRFIQGLLKSGLDFISIELLESFPFLKGISKILVKSPAISKEKVLLLLLGASTSTEVAARLLQVTERWFRAHLEHLRSRTALRLQAENLAGVHRSARGMVRRLLSLEPLLQNISEEAKRVMRADAAAVLISTDETNSAYTIRAQSGFRGGQIPLSPSLFARVFDDFGLNGQKAVSYRVGQGEIFVMAPLLRRGEASGTLLFYSKDPDYSPGEDRLHLAEIYGDWISMAIENAVMFQRVAQGQKEWENAFDSIAAPIYIIDNNYRLKKINKSLADLAVKSIKLPVDPNCYRYLFNQNAVCPWCPVPKDLQTRESITVQAPIFPGGLWQIQSFPHIDQNEERIGSINVLQDISLIKRMQEQLIESEKYASAGKLISGVAHEVRNPLFGISATVRALANELGDQQDIKPFLDVVTSETARLNRLMEDLLNYSRPVRIDQDPSDIADIVREVMDEFEHTVNGESVEINLLTAETVPSINVDRNKMKQVLFNLIENSNQHVRDKCRIDIMLQYLSLSDPPEIHLIVKDNGIGINLENLHRVFDPFFTTRQKGTGLGLSIVRKVIHDHGGRISVESHLNVGTTFRISLPVHLQSE
jgi:signal transduction histidine kinase